MLGEMGHGHKRQREASNYQLMLSLAFNPLQGPDGTPGKKGRPREEHPGAEKRW